MIECKDIASYTLKELNDEFIRIGEKKFRSGQVYDWIHKKIMRKKAIHSGAFQYAAERIAFLFKSF